MGKVSFNLLFVFRILIGALLLLSGFQKAVIPHQNFLYVIQTYDFLPTILENLSSRILPWVEILTGVFLIAGLWTKRAALLAAFLFFLFISVIAQALIRGLDIGECGCFGEMLSVPPQWMISLDFLLFLALIRIIVCSDRANVFSLDRYFK